MYQNYGCVGKLVTPADCKSAASGTTCSTQVTSTKSATSVAVNLDIGSSVLHVRDNASCSIRSPRRVTAKVRNATNLGLKVFMDARSTVTAEEGDRYSLRPPSFVSVSK